MSILVRAVSIYRRLGLHENKRLHQFLRGLNRMWIARTCRFKIRGTGHSFIWTGAILRNVSVRIEGKNNSIHIEPDAYLYGVNIYMRGSNHTLRIADNCRFEKGGTLWFEDNNCKFQIGRKSTMESFTICLIESNMSVTIGTECMFSDGVDLRTADAHSVVDLATGKRTNWPGSITINDHVWIASHARISKGVTVGSHSVIAAGSIVTRDVPEKVLAGGIPARVLKENFTWRRERLGPNDVVTLPQHLEQPHVSNQPSQRLEGSLK